MRLSRPSRILESLTDFDYVPKRGWIFSPTTKVFTFPKNAADATGTNADGSEAASDHLEKRGLVRKALEYATELEAIV